MLVKRVLCSSTLRGFSSLSSHTLKVGDTLKDTRTFSSEDVLEYSKVSHDCNPLHFDSYSARSAGFEDRLVHGMLVASLFPQIISSHFVSYPYRLFSFYLYEEKYVFKTSEKVKVRIRVTSRLDVKVKVYVLNCTKAKP